MSICSDIDNTTTIDEFLSIQTFLNSKKNTYMGEGIGLEIGNSFMMYAPPTCSISYFSENHDAPQIIIDYIKKGYIDCMHSYGEKVNFIRDDAITALKVLNENGCKINVWVDHAKTIDNLGNDCTFGIGDHPDSDVYHADLTLAYGIKFVWLGRVTMIIGQSAPITLKSFINIFDMEHPLKSLINASKEFAKNILAVFGNKKYTLHKKYDLIKITTLDDGQKVYEFIRFDNYWQGVGKGADSKNLSHVISMKTLERLKEISGYMIVYTHFGKNDDCDKFIPVETQRALLNLANEYQSGNIYVTTTSKLLNYYINHRYLDWSYNVKNNETIIYINSVKDPIFGEFVPTNHDLQGITFYVPNTKNVRIFIRDNELLKIQRNKKDNTGRVSVSIPLDLIRAN